MDNRNISLKVLNFFIAIVIFIAVTADRNILISHFTGKQTNVIITSFIVLIILFGYLIETIIKGSIKYQRNTRVLLTLLLVTSIYFLAHGIVYPTSLIPIKYSLLSVFTAILLTKKKDFSSIIDGFAVAGLLLSIAIILQQVLLFVIHGGSLSSFDVVIQGSDVFRSKDFVAPYGLGLIEYGSSNITIGGIDYHRPALFSHEPKHASSILLLTFSTVLLSKFSLTPKKIMIGIHLIAILLVMALTSYLVLIITLAMYFVYKKKPFPAYYAALVIAFPIFIPDLLELIISLFYSGNSLMYFRLLSATATAGSGFESIPSLFGKGAYPGVRSESDSLLYYIYGQYGLIALVIVALFLHTLITYVNKFAPIIRSSPMSRFASILLINIFVLYNLYVFSDFLNLFSASIVLFVSHIVNKNLFTMNRNLRGIIG